MRWFTCTPRSFPGNADFFARDSGLLSMGFKTLGISSRCVMPGTPQPDDLPEVLRTDYVNLASPGWWRAQRVDGVVLYAWGLPQYAHIAKAIRDSGAHLVLNQDSSGLLFPLVMFRQTLMEKHKVYSSRFGYLIGLVVLMSWIGYRCSAGFLLLELGRLRHLSYGNIVSCVSPKALIRYNAYLQKLGRPDIAGRLRLIPHPVALHFNYNPQIKKEACVVAVGRWDDEAQKRSLYLINALDVVLRSDKRFNVKIVGPTSKDLENWWSELNSEKKSRVHLLGRIPNSNLPEIYQKAQVLVCSSAYESFHIGAAEALCCGCTVVAPLLAALPSFEWFCEGEGQLAMEDTPEKLADALLAELQKWEGSEYDPEHISHKWCKRLHAHNLCQEIIRMTEQITDEPNHGRQ